MIGRLVLFGAGGDLAGRFVLPALATLHADGELPGDLRVVGADISDWDDSAFRRHVAGWLDRHAHGVPAASREALLGALVYRRVDVADATRVVEALRAAGEGPLVAYLALPQRIFTRAVASLRDAGLPEGSRVAVEKPFGEDLEGARALNAALTRVTASAFRVDHVLGTTAVREVLGLRLSARDVEEVEILWEETIGLEGRAGFYDAAGALRDVLQNHMLQLLAVVAAEPAAHPGEMGDRKLQALRAVRPPVAADMALHTRRARYAGYAQEDGVDPTRGTETFAEVLLEVDTPRWAGTTFRLRAGKALDHEFKGVVLHRRSSGPQRIRCGSEVGAYREVLLDVLGGGSALSVRGDVAEEAWRIVTPVLRAWADGSVPLGEYPPGSPGPRRLTT